MFPNAVSASSGEARAALVGGTFTHVVVTPTNASRGYRINANGDEEEQIGGGAWTFVNQWLLIGSSDEYEAEYVGTGDDPAPVGLNIVHDLATTMEMNQVQNGVGNMLSTGTIVLTRKSDAKQISNPSLIINAVVNV